MKILDKIKRQLPATFGEWVVFIILVTISTFCFTAFLAVMKWMWGFIL